MTMDINMLRSGVTVLTLLVFLAIVGWAWSAGRRTRFAEAAELPFIEGKDTEADHE
jgi:cytochrome c oxidase cbb3-type subunit 4